MGEKPRGFVPDGFEPDAKGLVTPGNIDMTTRPRVKNADGSTSTVRSISANIDGREVLIPTVSDDGRILSDADAIQNFKRTGKHLGMFDSPANATAFAQQLHQSEAVKLDAPPERSWLGTMGEVGKGILKGAGSTVAGLGEMAGNAGMLPGVQPSAFNSAMRHPAFTRAEEATTAQNTPQLVGKGLEMAAELAVPAGQAVNAIPSAARAGRGFQSVMAAAKDMPVNPEAAGQVALRIMQVAERGGGSLPQPVRQFLGWVTNPDKAPLTYDVARDFASGISRLSANEMGRLSPVVAREVSELRVVLNKAVAEAASKAGKGREYAQAMNEYAKAKRLSGMIDDVVTGAKRAAPYAGAAGAATWLTHKMFGYMGSD